MKKRRKRNDWDGNVKLWHFTISMNTILTSVFGTIGCAMVAWGLHWLGGMVENVNSIPKLKHDVAAVITEQARVRAEYHPPTKPSDPPPPAAAQ